MKKILLILLLLVFLVGCQPQAEDIEKTPGTCPFDCKGGNAGVTATIHYPTEGGNIYTSDRFAPVIEVVDEGEANAEGMLLLTGLDAETFGSYTGCYPINFYTVLDDPDDQYYEKIIFDDLPQTSISSEKGSDQMMTMYTRYAYTTYGVYEVCLTGDPVNEANCKVTGNKLDSSSSGPLTITSITEEISKIGGNAITLRLHVDAQVNAGRNEKLIDIEDTTNPECILPRDEGIDFSDVEVDVVLLGERHDCGLMRFENGEGEATVTCRIVFIGGQNLYPGYVELNYGFQNIQSVGFNIAKG